MIGDGRLGFNLVSDARVHSYRKLHLDRISSIAVVVDAHYVARFCNRAWANFAWKHQLPQDLTGRSLMDLVPRAWGECLFIFLDECSLQPVPHQFTFVWVTGNTQRIFEIQLLPVSEGVVISNLTEVENPRSPGTWLKEQYKASDGYLHSCRNCQRFRVADSDAWHWVPALISAQPKNTSYATCPLCMRSLAEERGIL